MSRYTKLYEASRKRRIHDAEVMLDILSSARGRPIDNSDKILDIGCGPPVISNALWNRKKNVPDLLVGLDICNYGSDNFWEQSNRTFIENDFLSWPEEECKDFNVIWSSFSAHCITAAPTAIGRKEKLEEFFQKISFCLSENGVFICQIPSEKFFYPAISHLTEKTFNGLGLNYDKYKEIRGNHYHIWPEGEKLKEIAGQYGLSIVLDSAMTSWRSITAKESFETWWSANASILDDIGLQQSTQRTKLQAKWEEVFQESIKEKQGSPKTHELAPTGQNEEALGCLHARILLMHQGPDYSQLFKQTFDSCLTNNLTEKCRRLSRNLPKPSPEQLKQFSQENTYDSNGMTSDQIFGEFTEKFLDPVIGILIGRESIRENIIYCMAIHGKERYRVFSNTAYENENKLRQQILTYLNDNGLQLSLVTPQAENLNESGGIIIWFVQQPREDIYHLLKPNKESDTQNSIQVITLHSFLEKEGEQTDVPNPQALIMSSLSEGFVMLLSHAINPQEVFGEEQWKEYPSAEGVFHYLAWQATFSPDQVVVITKKINSIHQQGHDRHSLFLAINRQNTKKDFLFNSTDQKEILSTAEEAAHTAWTRTKNHWCDEECINDVINFFNEPYISSGQTGSWTHKHIGERVDFVKGFFSKKNKGSSTFFKNVTQFTRCLFMVSDNNGWYHTEHHEKIEDLSVCKEDFEVILQFLGFGSKLFPYEMKLHRTGSVFQFPIAPGFILLLSLRQFVEGLYREYDEQSPSVYNSLTFYSYKFDDWGTDNESYRYGIKIILNEKRKKDGNMQPIEAHGFSNEFWKINMTCSTKDTEDRKKTAEAFMRLILCKVIHEKQADTFAMGASLLDGLPDNISPFYVKLGANNNRPEISIEWNIPITY